MPPAIPPAVQLGFVVLAAALGGAINSIAGGGTLLTFPSLVALGIPPLVANATSTVALWPGSVGAMWGYRDELAGSRAWAIRFAIPSLAGGIVGALLLLHTPANRFDQIVPWLVLGATGLFMVQRPVMRWIDARRQRAGAPVPSLTSSGITEPEATTPPPISFLVYQFFVGVYGGYFGAGIGILMLAALGFMGLRNIHRMNGLKNWGGLCMNAVAALLFAFSGLVRWPVAIAMAIGAAGGGWGGSRLAQRVRQETVRRAIMIIGMASGAWLLARQF